MRNPSAGTPAARHGPRRSYEARVLLAPLGASGGRTVARLRELGLDGVMTLAGRGLDPARDGAEPGLHLRPLGEHGWTATMPPPPAPATVTELVAEADILVLVAAETREVPAEVSAGLADAARARGGLIAALVVGHGADAGRGIAVLREVADMVVDVRGAELAAAFLDVLRGGFRKGLLLRDWRADGFCRIRLCL